MKKAFIFLFRFFLTVAVFAVFICAFVANVFNHIYYGPSSAARDLFVSSVMETNAGRFLATWLVPGVKISRILAGTDVYDFTEVRDTPDDDVEVDTSEIVTEIPEEEKQNIELVDVRGSTYSGKMLLVSDPSRVTVATSAPFQLDGKGKKLLDLAEENEATAAINGGSFLDLGGDMPIGITFSCGELLLGEPGKEYNIVGFTNENVLLAGRLTYEEIMQIGFRDAVSFSPVLIKNGEALDLSRYSSGLNPRTAIGQRADGTVLLLVIDGRQPHSLGANYSDLIDIMLDFGAVNAATLDGGSSSIMVYENELITSCCSLYGPGRIPTCFIVK